MSIVLCADLMHTQGAAMNGWLSYLTIVLRLKKELPSVKLSVQLPAPFRPPFGFGMGMESLFTEASMASLAAEVGFAWLPCGRTQSQVIASGRGGSERTASHRRERLSPLLRAQVRPQVVQLGLLGVAHLNNSQCAPWRGAG